jgi:cell wall-associated NlpC family hydrolase
VPTDGGDPPDHPLVRDVMPRHARSTLRPLLAVACTILPAGTVTAQSDAGSSVTGNSADVIQVETPIVFGEEVVRTARRYVGARYVWGGESPRGFDCSGFVQWVFARRGVAMPRTAREQAGVGDAPYPGDLRPGDLLFFWGGTGAQHVAIYAGGDSIVHASTRSRRVQVDRMHGTGMRRDWFGQRLIAVRRVMPRAVVAPAPASPASPVSLQTGARVAPSTRMPIFAGGSH